MYISENCQWTPYGTNPELDKKVDSDDWDVREAVARQGYGLEKLVNDNFYGIRREVARQGYGLDILVNDKCSDVREAVEDYLKDHNLSLSQWKEQNPDKGVLDHKDSSVEKAIKDFIYKIDDSNKLDVQTQYESIDEFFDSGIEDDIKTNTLVIYTVETKMPLFKIEKNTINEKINYKFIIDITNENNDNFSIKSTIETQEQLNQKLEQTIEALKQYPEFSKYADELENCLK